MPPPRPGALVDPVLLHTFDYPVTGIVDVFVVNLTLAYTTGESHLARIDLTGWAPGRSVTPELVYTFDERARGLNGSCLLAPGVLAVADCFAGLIWRVDPPRSSTSPSRPQPRRSGRRNAPPSHGPISPPVRREVTAQR